MLTEDKSCHHEGRVVDSRRDWDVEEGVDENDHVDVSNPRSRPLREVEESDQFGVSNEVSNKEEKRKLTF